MATRTGRGVPSTRDTEQVVGQRSTRGMDRGILSCPPMEDISLGTDFLFSFVDTGHLPFTLRGIGIQAKDAASGLLVVSLYRITEDDVLPSRWTARLAFEEAVYLEPTMYEYLVEPPLEKTLDRSLSGFAVGVRGTTGTVIIRGTEIYTPPSFAAWSRSGLATSPTEVVSSDMTWTRKTPSIALLSQIGVRLR